MLIPIITKDLSLCVQSVVMHNLCIMDKDRLKMEVTWLNN